MEGRARVVTPGELPNAPLSIVNAEAPHSKLTLFKAEQLEKAPLPMVVTEAGMTMLPLRVD